MPRQSIRDKITYTRRSRTRKDGKAKYKIEEIRIRVNSDVNQDGNYTINEINSHSRNIYEVNRIE